MNKYYFNLEKKKIFIYNIYGSINIYNIENYLKRIESLKYKNIVIIPNNLIYNKNHLLWAIFISKYKFHDKINTSKDIKKEVLLTLNCSNQINKINSKFFIKKGKNNIFFNLISSKKIDLNKIKKIIQDLNIKTLKIEKYNKKNAIKFYNIKNKKNIEDQIIEKMAIQNKN